MAAKILDDSAPAVPADEQKQKPPRRSGSHGKSSAWEPALKRGLVDVYTTGAFAVSLIESRNPQLAPYSAGDTLIILQRADALADAWIELARQNSALRQLLLRLVKVSAVGAVISAHLALARDIAQHHRAAPIDPTAFFTDSGAGTTNG